MTPITLPVRHTLAAVAVLAASGLALTAGLSAATAHGGPVPTTTSTVPPEPGEPPPPPPPGTAIGLLGADGRPVLGPTGAPLTVTADLPPVPPPRPGAPATTGPTRAEPTRRTAVVGLAEARARTLAAAASAHDLTVDERVALYVEAGVLWPTDGTGGVVVACGASSGARWDGPAAPYLDPTALGGGEVAC